MNTDPVKEVLSELFSHLERLETQSTAILLFLKEKKRVTDKQLAPYLERAGNASNVRWRAERVRMEYLLTQTGIEGAKSQEESEEEKSAPSEVEHKASSEKEQAAPDSNERDNSADRKKIGAADKSHEVEQDKRKATESQREKEPERDSEAQPESADESRDKKEGGQKVA